MVQVQIFCLNACALKVKDKRNIGPIWFSFSYSLSLSFLFSLFFSLFFRFFFFLSFSFFCSFSFFSFLFLTSFYFPILFLFLFCFYFRYSVIFCSFSVFLPIFFYFSFCFSIAFQLLVVLFSVSNSSLFLFVICFRNKTVLVKFYVSNEGTVEVTLRNNDCSKQSVRRNTRKQKKVAEKIEKKKQFLFLFRIQDLSVHDCAKTILLYDKKCKFHVKFL